MTLTARAPAKLNLSLAVVGREADGFHRLVSGVVPLALADTLEFTPGGSVDTLSCDDAALPTDGTNLVLKAAAVFRAVHAAAPQGRFTLLKSVPHGAGLGGGSSDAAAALRLLNEASGRPFDTTGLRDLAAQVGSDCAFFIKAVPAILRGRGERLEPMSGRLVTNLRGRRVLLIKPPFGISTASAYGWLAQVGSYTHELEAERSLADALSSGDPAAIVALGNDLQAPVFSRYSVLADGLSALRSELSIAAVMTGSGSACFAFVDSDIDLEAVRRALAPAWGPEVWVCQTCLA